MPLPLMPVTEGYSKWTGFIYIFNLIVGTGALALPHSFSEAGWLLSLIAIIALAFMSYVTVTFVIESMATTNAIRHWQRVRQSRNSEFALSNPSDLSPRNSDVDDSVPQLEEGDLVEVSDEPEAGEYSPLLENSLPHRLPMPMDYYSITERVELGEMVKVYFKRVGVTLFYICICVYLYGDLAIYATAVAKSLRDVTCTSAANISNENVTEEKSLCWEGTVMSRSDAYRLYVVCFMLLLGPFVFFNVQKTKYLQIFTTVLRWVAFVTMIALAIKKLSSEPGGEGHPSIAKFENVPELFGVCVYSFMCHHSLPSLVTPVNDKRRIGSLFAFDYFLILCFYLLLSFTGIFAFEFVDDLYTLNFQPEKSGQSHSGLGMVLVQYFLALFPVFTLSTNFPIIGITLRNNLQVLILRENPSNISKNVILPLLAVIPPIIISIITEDVGVLMNITGTYSGAAIQYVIPAILVYKSRILASERIGMGIKNCHASVFRHTGWIVFVLVWAAACVILVTINNIINLLP